MSRARTALIAAAGLLALTAAGHAGHAASWRGEVVVRNQTFSSLDISVAVGTAETRIGTAPPEFSNTLYFPIPPDGATLRLRARLPGARDVLHESQPLDARAGMRVRWTLPDNRVDGATGAPREAR